VSVLWVLARRAQEKEKVFVATSRQGRGIVTREQEKALFGNVCEPDKWTTRRFGELGKIIGVSSHVLISSKNHEIKNLLSNIRSHRDAIGALIENVIGWNSLSESYGMMCDCQRDVGLILSAVIQDTWEDVKKVWELPEVDE
jgi:hypothetical protein